MKRIAIGAIVGTLGVAGLIGVGWHFGAAHIQQQWTDANNKMLADEAKQHIASDNVTIDLGLKFAAQVQTIYVQGVTITKEVPKYVTVENDRACTINNGFVRVFNAAATGSALPDTPVESDAAGAGVALSTVAATTADAFTVCRANAAQLTALQGWVQAQAALYGAQAKP